MTIVRKDATLLVCACLVLPLPSLAASARTEALLDSLIGKLQASYVFPDKVPAIAKSLRDHAEVYDGLTENQALAERLSADLLAASQDKHLRVDYSPEPVTTGSQGMPPEVEAAMWATHNFGVSEIQRLPFNIGYFKLDAFPPASSGGETLAASLQVLAHVDALILDLRENHGGEPSVSLLASYFLDKPEHLLDMYWREKGGTRIESDWTQAKVKGTKFGRERPLYILTGPETMSAAEAFSYAMKTLKRAVLVGTTTAGAAHAGDYVALSDHLELFLPNGRPVSPITHGNWEGIGISPDIVCPESEALAAAQKAILEAELAQEKDAGRKTRLNARIGALTPAESNR